MVSATGFFDQIDPSSSDGGTAVKNFVQVAFAVVVVGRKEELSVCMKVLDLSFLGGFDLTVCSICVTVKDVVAGFPYSVCKCVKCLDGG